MRLLLILSVFQAVGAACPNGFVEGSPTMVETLSMKYALKGLGKKADFAKAADACAAACTSVGCAGFDFKPHRKKPGKSI